MTPKHLPEMVVDRIMVQANAAIRAEIEKLLVIAGDDVAVTYQLSIDTTNLLKPDVVIESVVAEKLLRCNGDGHDHN